jgi:hypothetical protein
LTKRVEYLPGECFSYLCHSIDRYLFFRSWTPLSCISIVVTGVCVVY